MTATYHLHTDELSIGILDSIKELFKDKTIKIIVSEATDETEFMLLSKANGEKYLGKH